MAEGLLNNYLAVEASEHNTNRQAAREAEQSVEKLVLVSQFKTKLDTITNTTATVELLSDNSYSDQALESLINLTDEVLAAFEQTNTTQTLQTFTTSDEKEDAAFAYFNLPNISEVLDCVITVSDSLKDIDRLLEDSPNLDEPEALVSDFDNSIFQKISEVFVPPDKIEPKLGSGNGEFAEKQIFDRTKTILLILQENFGIDIKDTTQLNSYEGIVNDKMMRQTPYRLLDVHSLERKILVCDEEGNVTFIFDSTKLDDLHIATTQLREEMTKSHLKGLINQYPEIGQALIYSENFIQNIIRAIEQPTTKSQRQVAQTQEAEYLKEKREQFDWGPIRDKGIQGFIEEARKRGILNASVSEVLENHAVFYTIFRNWLNTQPEDQKETLYNQVYKPNEQFDWGPIRDKGIQGFIEEAQRRNVYGLPAAKAEKASCGFYNAFKNWLKTQPEDQKETLYNQVYKPNEQFDWGPIRDKGIQGFIEEARKRGVLGLSVFEIQKNNPAFDAAFRVWLNTQPEEQREALRNQVCKPDARFDWQPIIDKGIQGFIEEAQKRGLLGLSLAEVQRENRNFYRAFKTWLKTQPEEQRETLYNQVYKPNARFDWQPIIAKGIQGFIEEARKRGVLGLSVSEIQKNNPAFHAAFRVWLKTQPEDQKETLYNQVYKPDARSD